MDWGRAMFLKWGKGYDTGEGGIYVEFQNDFGLLSGYINHFKH
jgi:hypothetical protein